MRWVMRRMASDRAGGRALHLDDLPGDVLGRARRLHRQRLHLGGDHREAAAGLARSRGLDRRVEREQVGLRRDGLDQLDDVADFLRRIGERCDLAVSGLRLVDGHAHDFVGLLDLARDLGDRS